MTSDDFHCKNCGFTAHDLSIFQNHDCYADRIERDSFDEKAHYGVPETGGEN